MDWIRDFSSRENRSRSGRELAGAVVATCLVLSICRPWSQCAVIPIYEAPIKTYSLEARLGCKRSWPSCGLLHALFAMFRTNQPYDGSKLCAADPAVMAVAGCA